MTYKVGLPPLCTSTVPFFALEDPPGPRCASASASSFLGILTGSRETNPLDAALTRLTRASDLTTHVAGCDLTVRKFL
jgi:hypothetical protein